MNTPLPQLPTPNAPFGHCLRHLWSLDSSIHFLNHGSFGATPRHVQAAQANWRDQMEREPVKFMVDTLPDALTAAATRLAKFVGAAPASLAFVENATSGVNAVLRSIDWQRGDRIVLANHAYSAVKNTVQYLAKRYGLIVVEAEIPWPINSPDEVVDAYTTALSGGARIAIIDHVFSPLAIVAPVEAIIAFCRARGVQVLIDGAHSPGMLPLSLGELDADWYIGNCHKWLCAPKGCGFIVANAEGQRDLHPAVISNFYGEGFAKEFSWAGTTDPSAQLSIPAALDFIEALGAVRYRDALKHDARAAAKCISEAWGVAAGAPPEMFAAMVSLPLPINDIATPQSAAHWRSKLLAEHNIEVPVLAIDGRHWVRISAQVYNDLSDVEALAKVFR